MSERIEEEKLNGSELTEAAGGMGVFGIAVPACPGCGSKDVKAVSTMRLGTGAVVRIYKCEKCGHKWSCS